jgi:hypothetical protein
MFNPALTVRDEQGRATMQGGFIDVNGMPVFVEF